MFRRAAATVALGLAVFLLWNATPATAHAQQWTPLNRHFYYPYYYFPHNYWPSQGAPWPNPKADAGTRPPGWMAYPPFREPHWRYEFFEPQFYHRGFHFWLDQM